MYAMSKKSLLLALTALIVLTACRKNYRDTTYRPLIEDEAKLLDLQTAQTLKSRPYPKGFAFIVCTVEKLPPAEVGSAVDTLFEEAQKRCPDPKSCKQRGVFIVVSANPALMQVRTGSDLATQAQWAGITSGSRYIAKQQLGSLRDVDSALPEMVDWLSTSLPAAIEISWVRRLILNEITQDLYIELEGLSLPSESFYGKYVLRPFLHAGILAQRLSGTWWVTYIIAAVVILLVRSVLRRIIMFGVRRTPGKVASFVALGLNIAISLALAVPSAASAIFLSGSRLEDQIALRASGIPGVELFAFPARSFTIHTGIALALLLLVMRVAKGAADVAGLFPISNLPDKEQQRLFANDEKSNPVFAFFIEALATGGEFADRQTFESSPFTAACIQAILQSFWAGIKWSLLAWLFLPEAMTLVVMCFWVVSIAKGVLDYFTARARIPVRASEGAY